MRLSVADNVHQEARHRNNHVLAPPGNGANAFVISVLIPEQGRHAFGDPPGCDRQPGRDQVGCAVCYYYLIFSRSHESVELTTCVMLLTYGFMFAIQRQPH